MRNPLTPPPSQLLIRLRPLRQFPRHLPTTPQAPQPPHLRTMARRREKGWGRSQKENEDEEE